MINSFHKIKGAATLIIAIILITLSSLIIIFAANHGQILTKITGNQGRNMEAMTAAEAGLEFGINYLKQNSATILASPSGGYIQPFSNSSVTNVTLANSSRFTIVYTNSIANDYTLITITSTGVSADGSSTRIVSQKVKRTSLIPNPGTTSLVSVGNVSMSGNARVSNTTTNQSIQSGGSVTLAGSSNTVTSSGTSSTAGNIQSDIQSNSSAYTSMSQNDFLSTFFGTSSTSSLQSRIANTYTNSSNTNYNSVLNNMTGTSIWINQTGGSTATINGSTTIGSAASPVLLIVNGKLSISGNVTIYGFIFTIGASDIDYAVVGNSQIIGGFATFSDVLLAGNMRITYDPTVLSNLQNLSGLTEWAKVAGSWKDF